MHRISATASIVLASFALAVQTGGRFSDNAGNMVIENWNSWKATRVGEKGLKFIGSGKPLRGFWKNQGLSVAAENMEGEATLTQGNAFQLRSATITGDVTAKVRRTSPDGTINLVDLKTDKIYFDYEDSSANLTGNVHVDGNWGKERQTFSLDAPSATLAFPPLNQKSDFPIRTAEVQGRVTITFGGSRSEKDPKTGKTSSIPFSLVAKADSLTFNDPNRIIRLTGNVHITGSDPAVGGDVTASSAIIRLSSDRKVKEIELTGSPGTTVFKDLRPPKQNGS